MMYKHLTVMLIFLLIFPQFTHAGDASKMLLIKELQEQPVIYGTEVNYDIYLVSLETIAIARSGIQNNYTSRILQMNRLWLENHQLPDGSFPPMITFDLSGIPFCDAYYPSGLQGGACGYAECLYGFSLKKCPEFGYVITCSKSASTALALYALLDAGESKNSPVIRKGVEYLLNASVNGTYWRYSYTVHSSKGGSSSCEEGFQKKPSLVSTAYAIALLHRLGYNVSKPLNWLSENLKPENLVNRQYLAYFNGSSQLQYNFPLYQLGFPSVHLLHREPFEALALPLTLIHEEGLKINRNAVMFVASILNRTRLNFAGEYLLLVEVDTRKNENTSYSLEIHLTGANITEISENGSFSYTLEKVFRLKFSTPHFFIRGQLELHPSLSTSSIGVYLLKKMGNNSYMRVDCADFTGTWNGSYQFDINPRYGYWSYSIRPTAMALLWLRLAGKKELEESFLRKTISDNKISGMCESYLAGDYLSRRCTEDYALLLLLLDLHDGSFSGKLPETASASGNGWLMFVIGLISGLFLCHLLRRKRS